ncbi:putative crossover junction endonuclease EME2 [Galemys pyrenaicus]|uniref:Putative crossover junction endonuclease EME2 n=1 Tax=Galemys pyrenaicus TaxID=202257 RepID=A0A8J5ZIX5_GALPY|nr:putative crossover junction endonuclease EME2 [Galemys pyrenaicus]
MGNLGRRGGAQGGGRGAAAPNQGNLGRRGDAQGGGRGAAALKQLTVFVDPALLEDAGANVQLEALVALGCEFLLEPQDPARSVRWSPREPAPHARGVSVTGWVLEELLPGGSCVVQHGPGTEVLDTAWRAALGGSDHDLQAQDGGSAVEVREGPPEARTVDEHVLLLLEPAEFLRGVEQLTQARVLLQLWAGLDVLLVASWQELAQHVSALTRALAQRPLKCVAVLGGEAVGCSWSEAASGTHAPLPKAAAGPGLLFLHGGCWAAGERVTRAGVGLRAAWRRQVTQLNRVSPDVAATIVAAFPSPRLLQQAYATCSSEQERPALLADLPVTAGEGTQPRRVGHDVSRHTCLLLTTTNPDLLLDLGS